MNNHFEIELPFVIEDETEIVLILHDKSLVGSHHHFVRFDVYPVIAPSHPERHHGYWDLCLSNVTRERSLLTLNGHELEVNPMGERIRLEPVWRGDLGFSGHCTVEASLWDTSSDPAQRRSVRSSQHVIRPHDPDFPLEQIYIPVTRRCNLKCTMCLRGKREGYEETDVSPEVLEGLIETSSHVASASLIGIGEPLLNRNLYGIIGKLKRKMPGYGQVGITTNGTLMDRFAAARLVDIGVNWICFSVDAASQSLYQSIRIGADFDRVTENIAYAVEYGKASGRKNLHFSFNFTIMNENAHEIPAMVKLAASLGIDSVCFFHLMDFRAGRLNMLNVEVLQPLFDEAKELVSEPGLRILLPRLHEPRHQSCQLVLQPYVWMSGEVVPCCRMRYHGYNGPTKIVGNVRHQSLIDIWRTQDYREFRGRVFSGDFPAECLGCDLTQQVFT